MTLEKIAQLPASMISGLFPAFSTAWYSIFLVSILTGSSSHLSSGQIPARDELDPACTGIQQLIDKLLRLLLARYETTGSISGLPAHLKNQFVRHLPVVMFHWNYSS